MLVAQHGIMQTTQPHPHVTFLLHGHFTTIFSGLPPAIYSIHNLTARSAGGSGPLRS